MHLAIVTQRFGSEVLGGAELHARLIAKMLFKHFKVTVLTSCAKDYLTWENHYPAGKSVEDQLEIIRFPNKRKRSAKEFAEHSELISDLSAQYETAPENASLKKEIQKQQQKWLKIQGPYCPDLVKHLQKYGPEAKSTNLLYDAVILFSYRYYPTYAGLLTNPSKSFLVPTAEPDEILQFPIFKDFFKKVSFFIFNSPEERELLQESANQKLPGEVIGVGVDFDNFLDEEDLQKNLRTEFKKEKFTIKDKKRYLIYVGRIDKNKGCQRLIDYFTRYLEETGRDLELWLIGSGPLSVPEHPQIKSLGFVNTLEKYRQISKSWLLVMPSRLESLCLAVLEAWALSKPVLVDAYCEVLCGQCQRSNGGLYYRDYYEFKACLEYLWDKPELVESLGEAGGKYYEENYAWEVIEEKYLNFLKELY